MFKWGNGNYKSRLMFTSISKRGMGTFSAVKLFRDFAEAHDQLRRKTAL